MTQYAPMDEGTRDAVIALVGSRWAGPMIVTMGKAHDVRTLPGFVATENGVVVGTATYRTDKQECELMTLDSLLEGRGIASTLVGLVLQAARENGCKKVFLVTTNDNTRAMRFYQKNGFRMAAVRIDAMEESRKRKPLIPIFGMDGIAIEHEIVFEMDLRSCPKPRLILKKRSGLACYRVI